MVVLVNTHGEMATTLKAECEALRARVNLTTTKKRALNIYLESLLQRVRSVDYAEQQINALDQPVEIESTDPGLTSAEKMDFYCDALWAFSYSALDILAHVINIVRPRVKDEALVSFERARQDYSQLKKTKMCASPLPSTLRSAMDSIARRPYYKRLRKYRQCSLHRRAVGVQSHKGHSIEITKAYAEDTTLAQAPRIVRFICDDADVLKPKFTKRRELRKECRGIVENVREDIHSLLQQL